MPERFDWCRVGISEHLLHPVVASQLPEVSPTCTENPQRSTYPYTAAGRLCHPRIDFLQTTRHFFCGQSAMDARDFPIYMHRRSLNTHTHVVGFCGHCDNSIARWLSQAQKKIDELTSLDRALYEAGRVHFEKVCPAGGAHRTARKSAVCSRHAIRIPRPCCRFVSFCFFVADLSQG